MSEFAFPSFLNAPLAAVEVHSQMTLAQDFAYQSVGVIVVLGSLSLIALILVVFSRILRAVGLTVSQPQPGKNLSPAESSKETAGALPADLRAAIAAAVYISLGPSHKIIEIHGPESLLLQAWSMEGRRQIFQSHRVR